MSHRTAARFANAKPASNSLKQAVGHLLCVRNAYASVSRSERSPCSRRYNFRTLPRSKRSSVASPKAVRTRRILKSLRSPIRPGLLRFATDYEGPVSQKTLLSNHTPNRRNILQQPKNIQCTVLTVEPKSAPIRSIVQSAARPHRTLTRQSRPVNRS